MKVLTILTCKHVAIEAWDQKDLKVPSKRVLRSSNYKDNKQNKSNSRNMMGQSQYHNSYEGKLINKKLNRRNRISYHRNK